MQVYYYTYFIIYALDTLLGYVVKDEKKRKAYFCILAGAILVLLLGLRHPSMGLDLGYFGHKRGYLESFDILNTYSWSEVFEMKAYANYEKGYILLNKFIGSIYQDWQFLLFVCAVLSIVPFIFYMKRKSEIPLLSIFVLMGLPAFLMPYSGLRQAIAIGITVCSVKFIEDKKLIKFALTIFFASFFHYTSIFFLVAYPFYHIKMSDLWKLITILALPVVYVFKGPLFTVFSKIFKDNARSFETGALTLFLVFCAVYIYLIIMNRDTDETQNGVINLFYIACVCQAFGSIHQLAIRVGYYFMPYLIIALPNTVNLKKDNKREFQTNFIIILLAFIIYGLYAIRNSFWAMAYPYYFFWEW